MDDVATDRDRSSESDSDSSNPSWVDDEFAGKHGSTALGSSVSDEQDPGFHPQDAGGLAKKVGEEASEETNVVGKAKKALEEVDRQVGGVYEQREDRAAPSQVDDGS